VRNRRISLLDIGLDEGFDAAMTFAQSVVRNINAGHYEPVADIDFVRSSDPHTVMSAFTASCDVLHVMSHGDYDQEPLFVSSDGALAVKLGDLGAFCAESHFGIGASAIIADGCRTGTGAWQRAVRDCLRGPVAYIGTSASIGWHESTVFCSAFYGSLFRNKGKGFSPEEQALDAATRANEAFQTLTGRRSPYRMTQLTPSRTALRAGLA
jgi:hypothetical protein